MSQFNSTSGIVPMIGKIHNRVEVPKQLLHRNTTTVNQKLGLPGMFSTFVARDLRNMRILALTASSASIVACAVSIFFLVNIDRRRRVFRHDLIFFLIICDLVKALVLMIYPLVILVRNSVYAQPAFFNTLGWFTAYCVEGADLAIFFFAVHFALLIFTPSWKWRRRGSGKIEGGLYCVRAYIWPITALVPVLLASLAFVNFELIDVKTLMEQTTVVLDNDNYHFRDYARLGGYKPYSAWCYLPPYPLWYKLVLSWGPRYFLIIFILVLYISIYVFVKRESNKIKRQLFDFKEISGEREAAKATTKREFIRLQCNRFFYKPMKRFLMNVVGFLSFSVEDTSSSSRGLGSMYSGSFYTTDNSTSSDQVPDKVSFDFPAQGNHKPQLSPDCEISNDTAGKKDSLGLPGRMGTVGDIESRQQVGDGTNGCESRNGSFIEQLEPTYAHVPQGKRSSFSAQSRPPARTYLSPMQSLCAPQRREAEQNDQAEVNYSGQNYQPPTANVKDVQASFQKQTYAAMKRRRVQIQKNLRSIFIYPFSYIAIWIFPLIVDITQYNYEIVHGPIVWLVYIATIAQPLNGLVDTLVFVYREKPWKCSWRVVQTKELLDAYSLKGGFSEKDIAELYHSDLGKKGWYYCSRFDKYSCWKHKPQRWKRAAWYIHRFFRGFIRNDYNFEDHCDELASLHNGSVAEAHPPGPNVLKSPYDQRERQISFPSDSTAASAPFAQPNRNAESNDHVEVSSFWRLVHLFPMLHGIDLDELSQELRRRPDDNDFILPGLKQALNKNSAGGPKNLDELAKPNFKPGYSVDRNAKAVENGEDKSSAQAQPNYANFTMSANLDFSDVVRGQSPGAAEKDDKKSDAGSSEGDEMGMLAFLNDIPH
ncbi:hypothetical protein HG536_0G02590 [Torulaspora globosa]|uniref:G-protein coupled receptors family 1 profile domain-containing protein n=1 Tax=Torulaspora globosa TaxID=48254 RepID=A0A7G3ZLL2_9SACH|nr:uncharacterized protein HG536_0G02590 [Torulaspora globosa]QLL34398.1 hypothetical protein HG536_0G02590 [Torulaspora globosa]